MRHTLQGTLCIEGETYDFNRGTGYIECDSGRSFPQKYLWMQANDFPDESSFMLSIAKIPFCGFYFEGCICALLIDGMEYRLATYCGVKVHLSDETIILTQGKLRLEITVLSQGSGHSLASPQSGKMSGRIYENNDAAIKIRLFSKSRLIRELKSEHAGFEDYGYLHNI